MDLSDATKVLLDRIQKLEPKMATKIMGCILMQDHGEREMIRLAYAPEKVIENLVYNTKHQLGLGYLSKSPVSSSSSSPIAINPPPVSDAPSHYISLSPNGSHPCSCPSTFWVQGPPIWDLQLKLDQQATQGSEFGPFGNADSVAEDYLSQNQAQFVGFEDQLDPVNTRAGSFPRDFYYSSRALSNLNMRASPCSQSLPNFPLKTCHYFNKGFCKHGSSCRYLHGHDLSPVSGPNDIDAEDHMLSPGSLEKLELEITELLKSRRGSPVSIASLPTYYYDKYGKNLQAEGYLTESQRHGRIGYSLTKLLVRFNGIRLIDRPHGQHSVILADDASIYNLESRGERNGLGSIVSGARQIYLTFPAASTFTEEDVSNYFSTFGKVEDVRIPYQDKRMFGFVTFSSVSTASTVLAKGNPHLVCDSQVLVKPYREKPKVNERKYLEKNDQVPRCDAPRFLRRQLMEEHEKIEQALEIERRRLEIHLAFKNAYSQQYIDRSMGRLNASEVPFKYRTAEQFDHLLGVININSSSEDKSNHSGTDFTDQDSQEINLPESPFASIESCISAVF